LNALIIGGSGFIGTRLSSVLLERGCVVRVFDLQPASIPGIEFVEGDVRDRQALAAAIAGADTIFNLAAVHTDDVRIASLYYDVNVQGMRNLLAACEGTQVRKIVFTSTVACYGLDNPDPDENAPLAPFNDYSRSKREAETLLLEWGRATGKAAIIVRPSVVFGEANRGNVYNLLLQIYRRRFPMVGDGTNRKSMAYVGNVAEFLAWVSENVDATEIFNYADKPDLTTRELVETARTLMGIAGRPVRIPYGLALSLGQACDIVSAIARTTFPFSKIRVIKFCADTTVNASKAHASGFRPKYTLEHALRQTVGSEFAGERTADHAR
jgi:nucleoside-diphosphate-sugar epimerase